MLLNNEKQIERIVSKLKERYSIDFYHGDPFQVLITTILSQRTRDENTRLASKQLFSVYKTPEEIANASEEQIRELIKPSGFYRIKAGRIKEVSKIIVERYDGEIPDDLEELLQLPGVGRKTANCVLVYGFGIDAIPVDTHVHRISNRLGLVKTKTPKKTEEYLRETVPEEFWIDLNELLVKFGQDICRPIKPRCGECFLRDSCDEFISPKKSP
jgi:endonuclease-3